MPVAMMGRMPNCSGSTPTVATGGRSAPRSGSPETPEHEAEHDRGGGAQAERDRVVIAEGAAERAPQAVDHVACTSRFDVLTINGTMPATSVASRSAVMKVPAPSRR